MNSTRSLPPLFLAFLFLHPLGVPFNAQAKGNSAYDRVCLHWEVEVGMKVKPPARRASLQGRLPLGRGEHQAKGETCETLCGHQGRCTLS